MKEKCVHPAFFLGLEVGRAWVMGRQVKGSWRPDFLGGRQIKAGCTSLENWVRESEGPGSTDAARQFRLVAQKQSARSITGRRWSITNQDDQILSA